MLPDVDEFGLYLPLAFDHFSESLNNPSTTWRLPRSIGHHPPHLQITLRSSSCLFHTLTLLVTLCLVLDSSRKQRIGMARHYNICLSR
jgi:hypothetical protein